MINRPRFFEKSLSAAGEVDWEAVYQSEMPRVYNFLRYRLGDDSLAEDLTAQTFEKAWRNRGRYRRDLAAFSTWLFTIAKNLATDQLRKPQPEVLLETITERVEGETVEGLVLERDEFARLSRLLEQLPRREHELVALKYGAELNNRQIARISGLSESNVGTILHRVTQQLRQAWEQEA